ncbi:flagellar basal body rod C-terminal domain-containing protein [Paraglaciecola sp. L3A3]|uniref:FlgK family flagellar hook-associated protein n=1 Tax=Paraglaciecola sp. L3A3 TaxID=2686358 RepID=UPI00131BF941|nr:flagellar basal body rod C-terminal domain-containing protein [Paraglaciecola sp. L3A3]
MIADNTGTTRNASLMSIATSGVNASNELLRTTGHNIANVNTEGYVRERTSFESQVTGGVGQGTTERVINVFAQNQLRRDTTQLSEHENFYNKTTILDNVFASEANSISKSMSSFFASMQTASDDPTSIAARQLVLGEAESLIGQIGTISGFLTEKERELNIEVTANINKVNSLIKSIAELNEAVRVNQSSNIFDEPGTLKNQRDSAILELSSLLSIEVRNDPKDTGGLLVNLSSGESLVLQDGSMNLFQVNNDADLNYKSLQLTSNGKPTTLNLRETNLGGAIGGLFRYRDEVLETSRRELGQVAMAVTESLNNQNRLGMDYDGQLGGDIFKLPDIIGLEHPDNVGVNGTVTGRITQGEAGKITSADYEVTINSVAAGAPATLNVTVAALNADGSSVLDINGTPITQTYPAIEAQGGTFTSVIGGIELEFSAGAAYTAGDKYLLQPTKNTADRIEVSMTRPEDLALASPIHVEPSIKNLGDAEIISSKVTNTFIDNTFADSRVSGFNDAGGIHGPGSSPTGAGGVGAPAEIFFTAENAYEVRDSSGNVITEVTGTTDFNNMLAQAEISGTGPTWPAAFSALDNYPGYDLSIQGVPKAGDSFTIEYNIDGLNDNRNGLVLADLQNQNIMQLNNSGSGQPVSFHEAYANTVSDIGQKTSSADIAMQAAAALKSQSKDWFDSVSGVSLDEEAANLVRFQQSYSAAAKLIGTAQDLFNTILNIV